MGLADLIPGISGGTLAFILGIYERLIHAINQISYTNVKIMFHQLKEKKFKELNKFFQEKDYYFLLVIFIGIFTSILSLSKILLSLYTSYTSYVMIFFAGLILGSIPLIYKSIPRHSYFNYIFGFGGFLLGISLLYLIPGVQENPSLFYIFFSGFIAVSALFLPGISGSFILIILGMYSYILSLLQNIGLYILPLFVFLIGAILGMLTISRGISYLFKQDKAKTLYVLLGFVIGSLSIPFTRDIIPNLFSQNLLFHIGFFILGIIVVIILIKVTNDKPNQ